MEQQIRFCTSADGTRIAYSISGGGPATPLVIVNGWGFTAAKVADNPAVSKYIDVLAERRTIVTYDRRGIGSSPCDAERLTRELEAEDLAAVADAAGLAKFSMFSFNAEISGIYAVQHPDRVHRLVLWTPFVRSGETLYRDVSSMINIIKTDWSIARRALATITYPSGPSDLQRWFSEMLRDAVPPQVAIRLLTMESERDISNLLPRIPHETLVVSPRGQRGIAEANGVAALLPNVRVLSLDGDNNILFTHPEETMQPIIAFLDEGLEVPATFAAPRTTTAADIVTILFTDITDSTALTQRLGDAKAQELVRAHDTIVRDALRPYGGIEIKHTGDGIMASFPSASGALDCAVAIQRDVAKREGLSVHIGLNAGEPVAEDDDLFGTSVQLARRICDQAEGGEILASDVVRQLVAGKGFLFADRGETALRGFEDPVRIYEVRWQG